MEQANQSYQIYALIDPRDKTVRYVGMSKDADKRFYGHLKNNYGSVKEGRWVAQLRKEMLSPILEILETIDACNRSFHIACEREHYWIREMERLGHPLLNVSGIKRRYGYPSSLKRCTVYILGEVVTPINTKKSVVKDEEKLIIKQRNLPRPINKDAAKQKDNQRAVMSEEALTIRDIVSELGVSEKTVRSWISNGELSATRDMFGRYKITRADLNNFVRRREERYNEPKDD
jgi:excisionase family DNA binding protein